jgi:hypothetical protein
MKISRISSALIVAAAVILMSSCDNGANSNGPIPGSASSASVEQATEVAPLPSAEVDSVRFGRYVDPKNFQVGGITTKFKSTDQIFAAVKLSAPVQEASVEVRLLDSAGLVISSQTRGPKLDGASILNFSVSKNAASALRAGSYEAEVLVNGVLKQKQVIEID